MEELEKIAEGWFQLPCALCKSVLQILPDSELKPIVETMQWLPIGHGKHLCPDCAGIEQVSVPPDAVAADVVTTKECVCYHGHNDDCELFDFKQGYANLKGSIESIQELLSDGFEVAFSATSEEFVCEVRHPNQFEPFMNSSVFDMIKEIDEWVMHCNEGR